VSVAVNVWMHWRWIEKNDLEAKEENIYVSSNQMKWKEQGGMRRHILCITQSNKME